MPRGGTLFLDEIGDMPLPLQTKLLRVLENRTVQRVGGNDEIEVDFRLVCATHQDIQARVDDGAFRADLYYRINVFPIHVPSLAERQVDIPLIASAIMEQLANGRDGGTPAILMAAPSVDCPAIPGRATCANFAMFWNAR